MNGEPPYTTQEVFDWEAGWDSAVEGANTVNCHYSHFRSERSMKVWEAGRDAGKAGKAKPDFDPRASVDRCTDSTSKSNQGETK